MEFKFIKKDLDKVIKSSNINEIIVGEKCLTNKEFLKLFYKYENSNIRIKKLNNNQSNLNKYLNNFPSYEPSFFDIINRPKIVVKKNILEKRIKNKNILITGAGGSIGS